MQSAFATAVSADKKSSRGVVNANLLITATEPANVLAGLNTNKSAVPSRRTEKYQMRTSGEWKPEKNYADFFCLGIHQTKLLKYILKICSTGTTSLYSYRNLKRFKNRLLSFYDQNVI